VIKSVTHVPRTLIARDMSNKKKIKKIANKIITPTNLSGLPESSQLKQFYYL